MKHIFPLILTAAVISACTGNYKSPDIHTFGENGEQKVTTDTRTFDSGVIKAFPDIAIPSTHKIDLEKSVIFTSPTQTVGKITLSGSGDADSLYRFFEEQMAANGWSMVNAFQSATSSLYFAKPGKFVAVIIESTKTGSNVFINIGPE
mgnify:CR=1 FL=1|tara:strand:+ start:7229 stop:7672 length:444 start_codon:yes stop_codon:yes gene_type:complete